MIEKRLKPDAIKVCTDLKGEFKDDGMRHFPEVSSAKIKGNEQKQKHGKIFLNKKPLIFPFWESTTEKGRPEILWDLCPCR